MSDFVTENWYGVFAQARTPQPLVQRLSAALAKVMESKDVQASLERMGSSEVPAKREDFQKFTARELPLWESVVKRSGAKVD